MSSKAEKLKNALNRAKTVIEILNEQIQTVMHEHERPNFNLFLSSISAGLYFGFSVSLMAAIQSILLN